MLSLLLLSLIQPAHACGGLFHPPDDLAESETLEAILQPGDGFVQIDYRVIYRGDAESIGWVIPLPGAFESLEDGDESRFDDLRAETDPIEDLREFRNSGCGDKSDGGDTGGLTVVAQGFTGTYTWSALDATSSDALLGWLSGNGFELGDAGATIEEYVAEGGYQFLAVEVAEAPSGASTLPPLSVRYSGDRVEYPARMARHGMDSYSHVVLYVLGDQRARISAGWTEQELPFVWDDGEDPDFVRYDLWPMALDDAGRAGAFAVIYAGEYGGDRVTRFEVRGASEIFSSDVVFAMDGGTEEMHTVLSNRGGCRAPEGAKGLLFLPGLWWLGRRRRT